MSNKIIKVGSSAAVTIPRKVLASLAMSVGDRVFINVDTKKRVVVVEPVVNALIEEKPAQRIDAFVKKYKKELEALAD